MTYTAEQVENVAEAVQYHHGIGSTLVMMLRAYAASLRERETMEDAIFQISVRLGETREPDMDDMSWHTQLIARSQYLANLETEREAAKGGVTDTICDAFLEAFGEVDRMATGDYAPSTIARARRALESVFPMVGKPAVPNSCVWSLEDVGDGDAWRSACGELWSFIDGGPEENRVTYCHHCGKRVSLSAAPTPPASEDQP